MIEYLAENLSRNKRGLAFLNYKFWSGNSVRRLFVDFDTDHLLKTRYYDSVKIAELQRRRAVNLIGRAARRVPFWQERLGQYGIRAADIKTPRDIEKIPLTLKSELKKPLNYVADEEMLKKGLAIPTHTSGSTGEPFLFVSDPYFWLRGAGIARRFFASIAGTPYPTVIYIRALDLDPWRSKEELWFPLRGIEYLERSINDLGDMVRGAKRPVLIFGRASQLTEIARLCEKNNHKINPDGIINTAEYLEGSQREFIESVLQTKVFDCYALRELGWLAVECAHRNLHLNSEWAYTEIADERGAVVGPDTEGRIVVTLFFNQTMPFIRYDTGDLGAILSQKCFCAATSPIIKFRGRQQHIIRLADGRKISFINLNHIFSSRHRIIRQYQMVQTGLGSFIVRIIPADGLALYDQKNIIRDLQKKLGGDCEIILELVKEIKKTADGKPIPFLAAF